MDMNVPSFWKTLECRRRPSAHLYAFPPDVEDRDPHLRECQSQVCQEMVRRGDGEAGATRGYVRERPWQWNSNGLRHWSWCYMMYCYVTVEWMVPGGEAGVKWRKSLYACGGNQVGNRNSCDGYHQVAAHDLDSGGWRVPGHLNPNKICVDWYATPAVLTRVALPAVTTPLTNYGGSSDMTALMYQRCVRVYRLRSNMVHLVNIQVIN